jgi:hypothetical protein
MKKTLAFLLVLLIASAAFGQSSVWFNGTFDEAKKEAQKEGKPILIDFWQDG